jgi:hypothetical protein
MLANIEGRYPGGLIPIGLNGVFSTIQQGEGISITDAQATLLEAAGFTVENHYLRIGDATGNITIPGTGNRLAVMVNGALTFVPTNTPFQPTAAVLAALANSGIAYTTELDTVSLGDLTLSNDTVTDAAAPEDPVGDVEGETAGSTLELSGTDAAKYALVDDALEVADTLTEGTDDIIITETLDGYVGSPKANPLQVTVTAA